MLAYYFFAILSILFHYASIFLLPLYFIVNTFRLSRSFLLIVLLICIVFSYADTMGWIIDILYRIAPDNPLISRLYYYYFIKVDTTVSVGILAHAKRFVLLILGLIFFRKIDKNYTLLVVLEPLIFILFSNIGLLVGRIAGMFLVTYLWYFSHLFKNLHYNTNKLLLGIFIIIWSGSVFFKDLQTPHPEKHGEYNYIPYKSILSERFMKNIVIISNMRILFLFFLINKSNLEDCFFIFDELLAIPKKLNGINTRNNKNIFLGYCTISIYILILKF